MDSYGLLRTLTDSYGLLRTLRDFYGLLWTLTDSYGLLRTGFFFLEVSLSREEYILHILHILLRRKAGRK